MDSSNTKVYRRKISAQRGTSLLVCAGISDQSVSRPILISEAETKKTTNNSNFVLTRGSHCAFVCVYLLQHKSALFVELPLRPKINICNFLPVEQVFFWAPPVFVLFTLIDSLLVCLDLMVNYFVISLVGWLLIN